MGQLALMGCGPTGAGVAGPWPNGSGGALVVPPAGNIDLVQGLVYDFSSITIGAGGTVTLIEGAEHENVWTIIGCKGAWNIGSGAMFIAHVGDGATEEITAVAPDGTVLEYFPSSYAEGGYGGDSSPGLGNRPGGNPAYGNAGGGGGGGGTGGIGHDGEYEVGGNGGGSSPGGETSIYGNNGAAGGVNSGGSGGSRGYSGSPTFFKVLGSVTVGISSTFDGNGQIGGDGGLGGPTGGGGGGGGAGGFGAAYYSKAPGGVGLFETINVLGALGGVGGLPSGLGTSGEDGMTASDGTVTESD